MSNSLNVDMFFESLGKILSDKYDVKITFTVKKKEKLNDEKEGD